jgi:hypothetical protein
MCLGPNKSNCQNLMFKTNSISDAQLAVEKNDPHLEMAPKVLRCYLIITVRMPLLTLLLNEATK